MTRDGMTQALEKVRKLSTDAKIHHAGVPVDAIQRCSRCGTLLQDWRGIRTRTAETWSFWTPGALI